MPETQSDTGVGRSGSPVVLMLALLLNCGWHDAHGQVLPLPPRETNALSGTEFVQIITPLSREVREHWILAQVLRGNVPDFLRTLTPISTSRLVSGTNHTVVYHVAPDYLAVGSDADYFLCPMTPLLAQRICDALGCTLPTRQMVNEIWTNATVKLAPAPIAPSPEMITVPVFAQHNATVRAQRLAVIGSHPLGELVGGTKKDVVISKRIYENFANPGITKPVVIYGWHYLSGVPIQPLYNGHTEAYADYSHGIRLVQMALTLDGQPDTVTNICSSPTLHPLLSDEGFILTNRYSIEALPPVILVHPFSQAIAPGIPASLEVVAAGDVPLAYQWQRAGTNLPGATSAVYELQDPEAGDEGDYRVRITNPSGSVLSDPASLTIITSPPAFNLIRRYSADRLALALSNAPAPRYVTQASGDLMNWKTVAVLPGNELSPPFADPGSATQDWRFYRAAQTSGTDWSDFENLAPGSSALFQFPSYSGSTAAFIDVSNGNPDLVEVTTNAPPGLAGTHSLHVAWTFAAGTTDPWLRLTSHQAAILPNPTLSFSVGLSFDAYADRELFISMGVRETGASGASGTDGGVTGSIEWVGGTTDNSTSPPLGRRLPAGEWTRICFVTPEEPVRGFTGDGLLSSATGQGVLEHLALAPGGGNGEYHLYLDNFQTFAP